MNIDKLVPEGVEGRVPYKGSAVCGDPAAHGRRAREHGLPRLRHHRRDAHPKPSSSRSPPPACASRTSTTCRSPRKRRTTGSSSASRKDPHPRFRRAVHAADRAPRARSAGLLRDPSLRRRRRLRARLRRAGHHPLRQPPVGLRRRHGARARSGLRSRRAGARHLLRHADHGAAARRQGRGGQRCASSATPKCARAATRSCSTASRIPRRPKATACSRCG